MKTRSVSRKKFSMGRCPEKLEEGDKGMFNSNGWLVMATVYYRHSFLTHYQEWGYRLRSITRLKKVRNLEHLDPMDEPEFDDF